MSRISLFLPLGVFCVIVIAGYVGFSLGDRHILPSALLNKPFPEFTAPELANPNRMLSRADVVGRPVLVNVWATWCPTCKAEHEELMRIKAISDVAMIGVNYKDDRAKALRWLAEFGNPYEHVVMDLDGGLGVDLGVYGAPETFLLDASGQIIYKRVGEVNRHIWLTELAPRLVALGVSIARPETLEASSS
jgi:cytochrome c biogenesis protein CcmG/thiol:disulfide interchange protein DsbE